MNYHHHHHHHNKYHHQIMLLLSLHKNPFRIALPASSVTLPASQTFSESSCSHSALRSLMPRTYPGHGPPGWDSFVHQKWRKKEDLAQKNGDRMGFIDIYS
jgi:hypothetical protein